MSIGYANFSGNTGNTWSTPELTVKGKVFINGKEIEGALFQKNMLGRNAFSQEVL